jgi:hypothetical protein
MFTDSVLQHPYSDEQYYLYQLDATLTLDASIQFKLDGSSWLDENSNISIPQELPDPRNDTSTRSFVVDAGGLEGYEAFVDIKIHSSVPKPLIISLGKRFHDTENMGHLSIRDRNGLQVSTADTPVRIHC